MAADYDNRGGFCLFLRSGRYAAVRQILFGDTAYRNERLRRIPVNTDVLFIPHHVIPSVEFISAFMKMPDKRKPHCFMKFNTVVR